MTPAAPVEVCVFDAYGTLFDFASAANSCRDALGDKTDKLSALWREKQVQYTWLRAAQGRHADFWHVTRDALDFSMDVLDLDDAALAHRLMDLYRTLRPFPEVPAMLQRLKDAGMPAAILSNGTPTMLADAVNAAGIGDLLDAVLSVEEVGVFKPHPKVYQLVLDRFGVEPWAVSFQSSNAWDIHAGSAFGFRTVWCNRSGQPGERLPGHVDHEIGSLSELPALLGLDEAP